LALIVVVCLPCACKAKREGQRSKFRLSENKVEAAVVSMVSASYGGRAHQTEMPRCPQGMSCVMYTDTPVKAANGWIVDLTPYHINMQKNHKDLFTSGRHSFGRISHQMVKKNMEAKFYKMNMFRLPQAAGVDIIFWCDADSIKTACEEPHLAEQIRDSLSGHALTVKAHEVRKSVHVEIDPAEYMCKARGYLNGKHAWKMPWRTWKRWDSKTMLASFIATNSSWMRGRRSFTI